MPDYRRVRCRANRGGCGKTTDEVGPISWRGLCIECSSRNVITNVRGLRSMSGEPVQRWRRGMALSVGAILLDDVADLLQTAEQADA